MTRRLPFALLLLIACAACSTMRQVEHRSSLMSYLYPDRNAPQAPDPAGARLRLPLRVGIAFVPPERGSSRYSGDFRSTLPAATETKLLNIVRQNFQGRDWVSEVVIIPSSYLVAHGGF